MLVVVVLVAVEEVLGRRERVGGTISLYSLFPALSRVGGVGGGGVVVMNSWY